MTTGASVYGLWLDRKGRVIADSWVIRTGAADEFLVVSLDSAAAVVAAHLEAHIVADEVEVTDETAAWKGIAFLGPALGNLPGVEIPEGFTFPGRRGVEGSVEWIFPASVGAKALAAASGLVEETPARLELLRIRARVPKVPVDIGPGDLPNEGGLDLEAISYSKGCYTGQEVMARVKALGRVRRTLRRVTGQGDPPAVPASLWQGGTRVGEVRSVAADGTGFEGLALVSVGAASGEGACTLGSGSGPRVSVEDKPAAGLD